MPTSEPTDDVTTRGTLLVVDGSGGEHPVESGDLDITVWRENGDGVTRTDLVIRRQRSR